MKKILSLSLVSAFLITQASASNFIDISGLDEAKVLIQLYNHSKPNQFGKLQKLKPLGIEEAKQLLKTHKNRKIDYVNGKPIKVRFDKGKLFNARLYDRDNPKLKAEDIIKQMLGAKNILTKMGIKK